MLRHLSLYNGKFADGHCEQARGVRLVHFPVIGAGSVCIFGRRHQYAVGERGVTIVHRNTFPCVQRSLNGPMRREPAGIRLGFCPVSRFAWVFPGRSALDEIEAFVAGDRCAAADIFALVGFGGVLDHDFCIRLCVKVLPNWMTSFSLSYRVSAGSF